MFKPKICIVFNGGACGDFLTFLILQQRYKLPTESRIIDDNGALEQGIESISKRYFHSLFFNNSFEENISSYEYDTGNSHFCNNEIINRFPKCKFYYIDDSLFCEVTTAAFVKKRINQDYSSIIEWLKCNSGNPKFAKIKYPNEETALLAIQKSRLHALNEWKKLGINRIDIVDIFDKNKCKTLVNNISQVEFDNTLFESTYDCWASKNKWLIDLTKNSDNNQE